MCRVKSGKLKINRALLTKRERLDGEPSKRNKLKQKEPSDAVEAKEGLKVGAETEGFEPPEPCGSTVFKTAAIDHSAKFPFKVGANLCYSAQLCKYQASIFA